MKYLLLLIVLASCNTVAKQQRKAETFYNAHPEKLAKQCADKFPPDTLYKQGEVIVKSDTVTIKGDSVNCPPVVNQQGETVYVKAKCPDSKIIHDSVKIVDTIIKIDNAAVTYISYRNDSLSRALIQTTAQKDGYHKAAANRLWWIIGLVIALGISIYINIKKTFL